MNKRKKLTIKELVETKEFKELQKALAPKFKKAEKHPLIMVCSLHKAKKENIRKLRKEGSWRFVAGATSRGVCSNQICGIYLCKWAGANK